MERPLSKWWETLVQSWLSQSPAEIAAQFAGLGITLILALLLDRLFERQRDRWLGAPNEKIRPRSILWAAKFPILVLLLGYLLIALFGARGWPFRLLQKMVTLFWYVAGYALLAKCAAVLLPANRAGKLRRRLLVPLLVLLGGLHLLVLPSALWAGIRTQVAAITATELSLAGIWFALLVAAGFWIAAIFGKALFLRGVLPRTQMDPSLARSIAGFVQFGTIVVGLWLAASSLGFSFSNLTLLIGAFTVGIGFGLQDVVRNVMGGLILLSEGLVRPDDVFEIGDDTGVVERIGIRTTTVRTWDGAQVIVPNSYLISEKVVDLSDAQRVEISVGVSLAEDPRCVERLLLDLASSHPHVLESPPPSVYFTDLGESSLGFTLYCHTTDRTLVARIESDLRFAVVEAFRQHEIEMAYPQLGLRLSPGTTDGVVQPA